MDKNQENDFVQDSLYEDEKEKAFIKEKKEFYESTNKQMSILSIVL